MKKFLLNIPLLGILLMLLLYSCRTEESTIEKANNLKQAKALFEKGNYQFQVLKYTKEIDWNNPIYSKGEEYETVEIPLSLKSGINIKGSEAAIHRLLFRKAIKDNSWSVYYVLIAPEKGAENINLLDNVRFQSIPKDFHGDIIVFDQSSKIADQLAFNSSDKLQELASTKLNLQSKIPSVCLYLGWKYDNGIFEPLIKLSCTTDERSVNPAIYGGPHGGGGGSAPKANQEIINNLKNYPCAQNLLEKLPNLNNDLTKLIKETLGESNKDIQINFFGETFADPDLQGEIKKVSKVGDKITKYDVALSDAMLKRSTQEYMLATMYHEFIHAYLGYEFIQLKEEAYHAKYPYLESYMVGGERKFKFIIGDHQAYTPFVNMIADAIQSFNPSFPRDRAISLAMEGLTDEGLPLLNQSYNKSERQGDFLSKGTKCSK